MSATETLVVTTVHNWIGGKPEAATSGRKGIVHDPATGETIAEVGFASAADVDRAVTAAKAAQQRLTGATAAMSDAETAYQSAADAVEARTREVTDIEERLTQLRRDRVTAHAALLEAQNTQDSMDAARHAAQRALAAAERAAKRLTQQ